MRPHFQFWLWLGGALMAGALACVAIAGGLLASRDDYPFWTSPPMVVAYFLCGAALVCFLAAMRDITFPFLAASHAQAIAEYRERKAADEAAAALRSDLAALMTEGNELSVELGGAHESQVKEFADLTSRLDSWWKRVEAMAEPSRPDLLPILRSESGRPGWTFVNHNQVYADWRNWLSQRLSQLEKVMNQL